MGVCSKLHPGAAATSCQTLLHPWTGSCTRAFFDMLGASVVGSSKFFGIIYLATLCAKLCRNKDEYQNMASKEFLLALSKSYLHSILFGVTMSVCFISTNCLYRNIFGKFYYWTIAFLPSFTAGAAIFLEAPTRRSLVIGSLANLALEGLVTQMEDAKWLTWNKNHKVLCFMAVNAALMHVIKYGASKTVQHLWFYTPLQQRDEAAGTEVQQQYSSWRKTFQRYFLTGVSLVTLRIMFSNPRLFLSPVNLLLELFKIRSLSLPVFLGLYATVFEVVEFLSAKKRKEHGNTNSILSRKTDTLVAALCAGACFKLKPSNTILNTAAIALLQLLIANGVEKRLLPQLPFWELSVMLWNGILYHHACLHPSPPPMMTYFMSTVTSKRSEYIYRYFAEFVGKDAKFT